MGWTFTYKQPGTSIKEFFEKEFNYNKPEENRQGKVIAASVKCRTAYLAYELIKGTERQVMAIVCLLSYRPKDNFNFGYKDMGEEMGPCQSDCPSSILDLLTETTYEFAIQWRKRCRERLEKNAKFKKLVKQGVLIKFHSPIKFVNGEIHQTFKFIGRNSFRDAGGFGLYRISGWRNKEFEVVP